MTTVSQFSWTRLEGIGLIATALGIAFLFQLPSIFFSFLLLQFDINTHVISMIGVVVGLSIILTSFSCSLSEDWNEFETPTLQFVVTSSLIISSIFVIGFFTFFVFLQPNLPPEILELSSNQRYLSAQFTGLIFVAIYIIYFYKVRGYFKR